MVFLLDCSTGAPKLGPEFQVTFKKKKKKMEGGAVVSYPTPSGVPVRGKTAVDPSRPAWAGLLHAVSAKQ